MLSFSHSQTHRNIYSTLNFQNFITLKVANFFYRPKQIIVTFYNSFLKSKNEKLLSIAVITTLQSCYLLLKYPLTNIIVY